MTSPSIAQLNPSWLNALAILKRATEGQGFGAYVPQVWSGFYPEFAEDQESKSYHLVSYDGETIDTTFGTQRRLWIAFTEEEFSALPEIERVEILTFAACGAWWLLNYPGSPFEGADGTLRYRDAWRGLCQRAGCYWKNTPDIRERWRLVDFHTPAHLLPSACFETRPKCRICAQPVATGAGGWQRITAPAGIQVAAIHLMQTPDSKYIRRVDGEYQSYRPDLHEECLRYAHRVIAPQVRAMREAQAKNPNPPLP